MAVLCPCWKILHTLEEEYEHRNHTDPHPREHWPNTEKELSTDLGKLRKVAVKRAKAKQLEFVCRKCDHHLFVKEIAGWVKKVTELPCPNCGESAGYNGRWSLLGYGKFEDWQGRTL